MPTVNEVLGGWLKELPVLVFKHWKSTLTGALVAANAIILAVSLLPKGSSRLVTAFAITGALVSCLKKDAGKELAEPIGGGEARMADAHGTPDDPNLVAVPEAANPT